MRTLLPKKEKYYKDYADTVFKTAMHLRYGISSCTPVLLDNTLVSIRKELVDWQANEDEDALCQTNVTTWLPVNYRNDAMVQYDMTQNSWGPGYYNSQTYTGPASASVGFAAGGASGNIIEVNTGGCVTRINLNPAITVTSGVSQFTYRQLEAASTWNITHNLGFAPNILVLDEDSEEIEGVVTNVTTSVLTIQFSQPVSGFAYLS